MTHHKLSTAFVLFPFRNMLQQRIFEVEHKPRTTIYDPIYIDIQTTESSIFLKVSNFLPILFVHLFEIAHTSIRQKKILKPYF